MKIWQEKYFPVFLILLNILLIFCIFDPRLFLGGDNVTFIILARSLLDGQGYRDLSQAEAPVFIGSPPGYPVFLMLLMLIFGDLAGVILLKLASVVLSSITLYFFYRLLRLSFDNKIFIIMTSLFVVVNFNILYPNQLELSDVLFNTFLFASLYFFMSKGKYGESAGIFLAVLATYTRYAGIVLVFALLAYLLVKKKLKKFWQYGLLSFALILPWAIYVFAHGFTLTDILTGAPYVAERKLITLAELLQRWVYNFKFYFFGLFPQDLLGWLSPPVWIGIMATIVIIIGFYLKIRAKFTALESYSIFYFMLIISWPQVWSAERYILPIIYFMGLYFAYALFKILKPRIFALALSLLILYNASVIFRRIPLTYQRVQAQLEGKISRYYPSDWLAFFLCCNWINRNLPDQAIIVSRKPNMVYFQTGNQGFVYPFSTDKEYVLEQIRKADYILIDNFEWTNATQVFLYPAMLKHPEYFEDAYVHPTEKVYVVKVKK